MRNVNISIDVHGTDHKVSVGDSGDFASLSIGTNEGVVTFYFDNKFEIEKVLSEALGKVLIG